MIPIMDFPIVKIKGGESLRREIILPNHSLARITKSPEKTKL